MKRITVLFLILLLSTSFRLNTGRHWLRGGVNTVVYYTNSLNTYYPAFRPLLSTAAAEASPHLALTNVVNPPQISSTNAYTVATFEAMYGQNSVSEVYASNDSRHFPTGNDAAASTERWIPPGTGRRVYTEFDVYINRNFNLAADFTNGSGGVDRHSVLLHEFVHGGGLAHTSVAARLMHASPDLSYRRSTDSDVGNGYRCLYGNTSCQNDEDGTGSIEFSFDFTGKLITDGSQRQLSIFTPINIAGEYKGVNILKSKDGVNFESINEEVLFFSGKTLKLDLNECQPGDIFYLEIFLNNDISILKKIHHEK
jgi:hypothetical protein